MPNTLLPLFDAPIVDDTVFRAIDLPGGQTAFACDLAGPTADAPVVVLLHGLMATASLNWGPYLDDLAARYRVVALDHRGHGRGIVDGTPFTLEQCADDTAGLLDVLGVEHAILVGYSMGGPIAQLTWRRHGERVRGLVFCATATSFGITPIDSLLLPLVDPILGGAGKALAWLPWPVRSILTQPALGLVVPGPAQRAEVAQAVRNHDLASISAAVREVLTYDSAGWIGQISVPTAVVVTERDRVVSPARQELLLDRLPDATAIRMGADHLACFTDPDIFGAALGEAIASVVERTTPAPTVGRLRARWRHWRSRSRNRGLRAGRTST